MITAFVTKKSKLMLQRDDAPGEAEKLSLRGFLSAQSLTEVGTELQNRTQTQARSEILQLSPSGLLSCIHVRDC